MFDMPRPTLKPNRNVVKLPIGEQGNHQCPFIASLAAHFFFLSFFSFSFFFFEDPRCSLLLPTYLCTQSPDICAKLIAALDTIQTQSSKGVKRKHDNNNDDALTVFRSLLTYKNDEDDKDDKDDKDDQDDKDEHPGWGKPEILKTASITGDQYNHYMVSFLVIFAVGLINSISPRCLLTICAIATLIPQSPSATTLYFTRPNMASLSKKYVQSYLFFCIHWQCGDERSPSTLPVPYRWLAHPPSACQALPVKVLVFCQGWWWPQPQILWTIYDQAEVPKVNGGTASLQEASCHTSQAHGVALTQGQLLFSIFNTLKSLKYQALNNKDMSPVLTNVSIPDTWFWPI